jgi:hypothetical protein
MPFFADNTPRAGERVIWGYGITGSSGNETSATTNTIDIIFCNHKINNYKITTFTNQWELGISSLTYLSFLSLKNCANCVVKRCLPPRSVITQQNI